MSVKSAFVYFCPNCRKEYIFLEYTERAYCPRCGTEMRMIERRKIRLRVE